MQHAPGTAAAAAGFFGTGPPQTPNTHPSHFPQQQQQQPQQHYYTNDHPYYLQQQQQQQQQLQQQQQQQQLLLQSHYQQEQQQHLQHLQQGLGMQNRQHNQYPIQPISINHSHHQPSSFSGNGSGPISAPYNIYQQQQMLDLQSQASHSRAPPGNVPLSQPASYTGFPSPSMNYQPHPQQHPFQLQQQLQHQHERFTTNHYASSPSMQPHSFHSPQQQFLPGPSPQQFFSGEPQRQPSRIQQGVDYPTPVYQTPPDRRDRPSLPSSPALHPRPLASEERQQNRFLPPYLQPTHAVSSTPSPPSSFLQPNIADVQAKLLEQQRRLAQQQLEQQQRQQRLQQKLSHNVHAFNDLSGQPLHLADPSTSTSHQQPHLNAPSTAQSDADTLLATAEDHTSVGPKVIAWNRPDRSRWNQNPVDGSSSREVYHGGSGAPSSAGGGSDVHSSGNPQMVVDTNAGPKAPKRSFDLPVWSATESSSVSFTPADLASSTPTPSTASVEHAAPISAIPISATAVPSSVISSIAETETRSPAPRVPFPRNPTLPDQSVDRQDSGKTFASVDSASRAAIAAAALRSSQEQSEIPRASANSDAPPRPSTSSDRPPKYEEPTAESIAVACVSSSSASATGPKPTPSPQPTQASQSSERASSEKTSEKPRTILKQPRNSNVPPSPYLSTTPLMSHTPLLAPAVIAAVPAPPPLMTLRELLAQPTSRFEHHERLCIVSDPTRQSATSLRWLPHLIVLADTSLHAFAPSQSQPTDLPIDSINLGPGSSIAATRDFSAQPIDDAGTLPVVVTLTSRPVPSANPPGPGPLPPTTKQVEIEWDIRLSGKAGEAGMEAWVEAMRLAIVRGKARATRAVLDRANAQSSLVAPPTPALVPAASMQSVVPGKKVVLPSSPGAGFSYMGTSASTAGPAAAAPTAAPTPSPKNVFSGMKPGPRGTSSPALGTSSMGEPSGREAAAVATGSPGLPLSVMSGPSSSVSAAVESTGATSSGSGQYSSGGVRAAAAATRSPRVTLGSFATSWSSKSPRITSAGFASSNGSAPNPAAPPPRSPTFGFMSFARQSPPVPNPSSSFSPSTSLSTGQHRPSNLLRSRSSGNLVDADAGAVPPPRVPAASLASSSASSWFRMSRIEPIQRGPPAVDLGVRRMRHDAGAGGSPEGGSSGTAGGTGLPPKSPRLGSFGIVSNGGGAGAGGSAVDGGPGAPPTVAGVPPVVSDGMKFQKRGFARGAGGSLDSVDSAGTGGGAPMEKVRSSRWIRRLSGSR
ncbi:hypothetical protein DFJ73DRAFT_905755 [Zopfochytrium polystomum]|nr:hypothetical protein DFJ73DRAFT_905755 [Zopfochytrium polystomum]